MQSCRVLKNTGVALRKWELHLVGTYAVTGDNPSPYLVGSGRGVAEDGRWALAADRTSRWFPPQPGRNPVPGDGQERVGCQRPPPPQAHGRHTAGMRAWGISLLKEMMALAPEQMPLFQSPAPCFNSGKVFSCFLPLIDQYPGQRGLKRQNQTLAVGVLQDQGSVEALGKPERIPPAQPLSLPCSLSLWGPQRNKAFFLKLCI